ncbi:CspA family cold shock protein [Pseudomonas sp. W4I3]|nr:CspA family cold shock protein [Pseudomonas sp. W4I3]
MKVITGTVSAYLWTRGEWLIQLDYGAEEVFINCHDWCCTELWVGKHMRFQLVHRPQGVYALPIKARNDGGC